MRLLLDTHVLIWLATTPEKIPVSTRRVISASGNVFISAATAWEYGIKRGKSAANLPFSLEALIADTHFERLDFPFKCHRFAEGLPAIHRDPFDRLLIAHALVLGATLVTIHEAIHRYPVKTLW